jgi:hypothetical protein
MPETTVNLARMMTMLVMSRTAVQCRQALGSFPPAGTGMRGSARNSATVGNAAASGRPANTAIRCRVDGD